MSMLAPAEALSKPPWPVTCLNCTASKAVAYEDASGENGQVPQPLDSLQMLLGGLMMGAQSNTRIKESRAEKK